MVRGREHAPREKEEAKEVQIQYKGEEVKEDIQLVHVRLWNASSDPILPDEYKVNHIKMSFGKEAKVLSVQVSESKPPTIKEEIDDNKLIEFADGEVYLKPIWLNTDNSLTLKVLLTQFQAVPDKYSASSGILAQAEHTGLSRLALSNHGLIIRQHLSVLTCSIQNRIILM